MVDFVIESWIWYGLATSVVLLRFASRIAQLGSPLKLKIDDVLMVVCLLFYTTDLVSINIVYNANTNLLPPGYLENHTFTANEVAEREYGSKMVLVVEQCQCFAVWLCKACLLIMYYRITAATFPIQNLLVKLLAAYVAGGFIVMEALYFGLWCRPFSDYWAVPTPNIQCSAAINHLILNAVLNLSSDVGMLCIALPMFIRSQLPMRRKIVLTSIFSIGVFVIISAVLNKYYSFTEPFGSMWTYWYIREVSTSLIVANLPFTWGLFKVLLKHDEAKYDQSSSQSPMSPRSLHCVEKGAINTSAAISEYRLSRYSPHDGDEIFWSAYKTDPSVSVQRSPSSSTAATLAGIPETKTGVSETIAPVGIAER